MQCCLQSLGQHCTKFLLVQCCPKSIKTTLNRFFLMNIAWILLDNIFQGFYFFIIVPKVLRQHRTRFLLVQCCPKSIKTKLNTIFFLCNVVPKVLRQHWTIFLFVQCCPKSIKTKLNTIFFPVQCCPKSIKTTLNNIFICAMLSQEY